MKSGGFAAPSDFRSFPLISGLFRGARRLNDDRLGPSDVRKTSRPKAAC